MEADAPRVSVVIPALNEARSVRRALARLPRTVYEVLLVDGRSSDGTESIARAAFPGLRVLCQPGHGKGDALRHGFAQCRGEIIVVLDADGSTDGAELPRFVAALLGGADLAKGSRFLCGAGSRDLTPVRRLGNRLLTQGVNLAFGTHFSDLCYGYLAFWRHDLPALAPDCDGFEIETLLALRAQRAGLRIVEVASTEHPRLAGQSKLHPLRDGCRIARLIVRERLAAHAIARRVSQEAV